MVSNGFVELIARRDDAHDGADAQAAATTKKPHATDMV